MAKGFVWLYYVSGTAYVLYGNAAAQLGNESRKAIIPGATPKHAPLRCVYATHTASTPEGCFSTHVDVMHLQHSSGS